MVLAVCSRAEASGPPAGPFSDLMAPGLSPPVLGDPCALLGTVARFTGDEHPELILAQRAIDRHWGRSAPLPGEDPDDYLYVDVDGWKSPAFAGLLSAAIPGTGQIYGGSKRGYLFLGIEAAALVTYFANRNRVGDLRDEAFAYAGDPNISSSEWSFEEFEAQAGEAEADRLRDIFLRDPVEFYSLVSSESQYFSGWMGTADAERASRSGFLAIEKERRDAKRRANFGLFAAIANSAISMVDAIRSARLNNFEIREDLNLKLDARTGHNAGATAILTHRFH